MFSWAGWHAGGCLLRVVGFVGILLLCRMWGDFVGGLHCLGLCRGGVTGSWGQACLGCWFCGLRRY